MYMCMYIFMCMYMYICTCIYVYVCLYMYICICIFVHAYMYMYVCTCIYVYVYLYMHMYTYIYIYMYICICMFVYVLISIQLSRYDTRYNTYLVVRILRIEREMTCCFDIILISRKNSWLSKKWVIHFNQKNNVNRKPFCGNCIKVYR